VVLAVGGSAVIGGAASATAQQGTTVEQGANPVIYGSEGTPQASYVAASGAFRGRRRHRG
jgi:hypothetical protein